MSKLTITEALAEIKTIDKRLEKKRQFVTGYLARQDIVKDPLEKDGGSVTALQRERQAISDLEERKIAIRAAISSVNAASGLTVGKTTRTISDWLVWKREIAPKRQSFLAELRRGIDEIRSQVLRKGGSIVESGGGTNQADVVVNINELELSEDIEALEEVLGNLDGQLSLKNAITLVDLP